MAFFRLRDPSIGSVQRAAVRGRSPRSSTPWRRTGRRPRCATSSPASRPPTGRSGAARRCRARRSGWRCSACTGARGAASRALTVGATGLSFCPRGGGCKGGPNDPSLHDRSPIAPPHLHGASACPLHEGRAYRRRSAQGQDPGAHRRGAPQALTPRHLGSRQVAWAGLPRQPQLLRRPGVEPARQCVPPQATTPVAAGAAPAVPARPLQLEASGAHDRNRLASRLHPPPEIGAGWYSDHVRNCGGCRETGVPTATNYKAQPIKTLEIGSQPLEVSSPPCPSAMEQKISLLVG